MHTVCSLFSRISPDPSVLMSSVVDLDPIRMDPEFLPESGIIVPDPDSAKYEKQINKNVIYPDPELLPGSGLGNFKAGSVRIRNKSFRIHNTAYVPSQKLFNTA